MIHIFNTDLFVQIEVLDEIFGTNNHPDLPIAIYSIVRPARTGKSFLLNFLNCFLNNRHNKVDLVKNDESQISETFKATRKPNKGICTTLKPIIVKIQKTDFEKISLILLDEISECRAADIFEISCILSSMQMALTLPAKKVQDTLDPVKDTGNCSRLLFLVSDWEDPKNNADGLGGGMNYINALFRDNSLTTHPAESLDTTKPFLINDVDESFQAYVVALSDALFLSNASPEKKERDLLGLAKLLEDKLFRLHRISVSEISFKTHCENTHLSPNIKQCTTAYLVSEISPTNANGMEIIVSCQKTTTATKRKILLRSEFTCNHNCDMDLYIWSDEIDVRISEGEFVEIRSRDGKSIQSKQVWIRILVDQEIKMNQPIYICA